MEKDSKRLRYNDKRCRRINVRKLTQFRKSCLVFASSQLTFQISIGYGTRYFLAIFYDS